MSIEHEDSGGWRNMFTELDRFPKVAALAVVTIITIVVTGLAFLIVAAVALRTGYKPDPAWEGYWGKWLDFIGYFLIGGVVLGLGVKRATTKADVITASANAQVSALQGAFAPSPVASVPVKADGDVIIGAGAKPAPEEVP